MPFMEVDTTYTPPNRLVLAIWGKEKTGKTSFAMTAPEPIYLFNFDYGYRPVLNFAEGKKVYVANYVLPDVKSLESYQLLLNQFKEEWRDGCAQAAEVGGTVVIDTGSQLWQIVQETMLKEVRDARRQQNEERTDGKQAKDSRLDYVKANNEMDQIIKRPLTVAGRDKLNAIYIQRSAPVYQGGQDTGQIQMHGFSSTGSTVEMKLFTDFQEAKLNTKTMKQEPAKFTARIDFSRYLNMQVRGMEIENPTFDKLMALVS